MLLQDTLASFLGGAALEGQGAVEPPPAQDDAQDEVVDPEGGAAAEAPLDDFFGGGGAVQVTSLDFGLRVHCNLHVHCESTVRSRPLRFGDTAKVFGKGSHLRHHPAAVQALPACPVSGSERHERPLPEG